MTDKMKLTKKLTPADVAKILSYDPETGILKWLKVSSKSSRWNTRYGGKMAGSLNCQGYVNITVANQSHLAHRLAWAIQTGYWPKNQLDHINLLRSDNRFCNLREATCAQNNTNTSIRRDNTSGIKGVHFHPYTGKWQAQIRINGKRKHLGVFDKKEDAGVAYNEAARVHFGDFINQHLQAKP